MPLMRRVDLEASFDTREKADQWATAIENKITQVRDDGLLPAFTGCGITIQEIFLDTLPATIEEAL